jgi:hypothetical protein
MHNVCFTTAEPSLLHCSTQIAPAGVVFYLLSEEEFRELLICGLLPT